MKRVESVLKGGFRITDSIVLSNGVTVPCIQGMASHTEVVSQKGYRYRDGFWKHVIENPATQERITRREMLGTTEHPTDESAYLSTPYDEATHIIMDAWLEGADPYIVVGLLNNVAGNNIKALVDLGHSPGVSTRGLGDVRKDSISQYIDEESYALITWDIVRTPNFEDMRLASVSDSLQSHPLFKEAVEMYALRDSADVNYNSSNLLSDLTSVIKTLRGL